MSTKSKITLSAGFGLFLSSVYFLFSWFSGYQKYRLSSEKGTVEELFSMLLNNPFPFVAKVLILAGVAGASTYFFFMKKL